MIHLSRCPDGVEALFLRHSERCAQVSPKRGETVPLNFSDTRGEVAEFSFSPQLNFSITGSASLGPPQETEKSYAKPPGRKRVNILN